VREVTIRGPGPLKWGSSTAQINGDITFDDYGSVLDLRCDGEIVLSDTSSVVRGISRADITVQSGANDVRIVDCDDVDVTFEDGASGGLVDCCVGGTSVTDNDGGNHEGDVY